MWTYISYRKYKINIIFYIKRRYVFIIIITVLILIIKKEIYLFYVRKHLANFSLSKRPIFYSLIIMKDIQWRGLIIRLNIIKKNSENIMISISILLIFHYLINLFRSLFYNNLMTMSSKNCVFLTMINNIKLIILYFW